MLIKQPNNQTILKAEYMHYDKLYKIGSIRDQKPICIFSTGYKIFEKNKHVQYFQSLQRQNYSNFHIVYVDDNSPEADNQKIVNYLRSNNLRLKNRIKIVYNRQHLGALGNMYFWINKYCNQNDIVVNVDSDDSLIGSQALNVINAAYQSQNIWFVYSNYLENYQNMNIYFRIGMSAQGVKTESYRSSLLWTVSHIRTFRKKLFQKIPIYMFLEYHLNKTTGFAQPVFYNYAPDAFQIFTSLELAGDDRVKYIDLFLYCYSGNSYLPNSCMLQHQRKDQRKARLKRSLNLLHSFEQSPTQVQDSYKYKVPLAVYHSSYKQQQCCLASLN